MSDLPVAEAENLSPAMGPWPRDPVARALGAIHRRDQLYQLLGVLLVCLAAALAWLVAQMLADRIWELAGFTRWTLLRILLAGLTVLACGLAGAVVLRRRNPLYHAREVERALDVRDEVLLTYVDLRRAGSDGRPRPSGGRDARRSPKCEEGAEEVAALLADEALERARSVDADQVADMRLVKQGGRALGALLAALAIFGIVCGSSFFLTLRRAVMPWLELPAPRETQIYEIHPGTAAIVAGEPVRFECFARGVLPESAGLRYEIAGSPGPTEVRMPHLGEGHYAVELPGFTRVVVYRIACHDAETPSHRLTPHDRPLVTSLQVRVLPPAYAPDAPVREVSSGNVQAIRESTLEVCATVSQPAMPPERLAVGDVAAWLELPGRRVPMTIEEQTLKGSFVLRSDTLFRVGYLADSGFASGQGVAYRAQAIADAPPEAVLARAAGADDAPAPADEIVSLRGRAWDDLGVRRVKLRCGFEGRPPREFDLSPGRAAPSVEVPASLDLAHLGARPGWVLICTLLVEDVYPGAAHSASSLPLRIPIVAPAGKAEERSARRPLRSEDPFAALLERLRAAEAARQAAREAGGAPEALTAEWEALRGPILEWAERLVRAQQEQAGGEQDQALERTALAAAEGALAERVAELMHKVEQEAAAQTGEGPPGREAERPAGGEQGAAPVPPASGRPETSQQDAGATANNAGQERAGEKTSPSGRASTASPQPGESSPGGQKGKEGTSGEPGAGREPGEKQGEKGGTGAGQGKKGEAASAKQAGAQPGQGEGQGERKGEGEVNGERPGQAKGEEAKGGEKQAKGSGGGQAPGGGAIGTANGAKSAPPAEPRPLEPSAGRGLNGTPGAAGVPARPDRDLLAAARRQLEATGARLREGRLDAETVRLAGALVEGIGAQREFTAAEKRGLTDAAGKLAARQSSAAAKVGQASSLSGGRQDASPTVRAAREALAAGDGAGSGKIASRPGEMTEDPFRRMIEAGQAKVLPEYRQALEEYYKSISGAVAPQNR